MDHTPEYYTVEEVAEMFRISKMTVYRMVRAGEIKSIRIGTLIRIPVDTIQTLTQPETP